MTTGEALRVGIVGFGRIGAEHAGWLAQARGIEAVAVADTTDGRRQRAIERGLKVFERIDDLLAGPLVDIVLIATPTAMHYEQARAALRAGKHVMIEKPMALDLAHSQKLVEESIESGRVLSVFHNRRWDLDFLTVKSAIDAGLFGKLINIESRLGQWASCVGPAAREYRPSWRNEAAYGGGGLYDWGSHFLDQLWRLFSPAKAVRVFAQLRGNVWTRDCDDFARICIDFDNGAVGMIEINTTTMRPLPRWHIDGTTGSADSPFSLQFDLNTWAQLDFSPADASPAHRVPLANAGLNEVQMWEQFAAAVRGEGTAAITAASVLPTMALLDAARESSRLGVAIELAAQAPWVR